MNKHFFGGLLLATRMMAEAVDTETAGTESTGVASESAEAARKRAAASNFLPIVRGRLPLLYVHALRFDPVLSKMATKDAAAKFATSVGKVFDIHKNRNFAYVDANWKPTAEDLASAEAWIAQVGESNAKGQTASGDKKLMQDTLDQYKTAGLASPEEAAAFAAARGATRIVGVKKGKAASTSSTPTSTLPTSGKTETLGSSAGTADDLLS